MDKLARELKFRAWDAENNEMVYGVHLNDGKPVKPGYQWFSPQNTVHDSEPMQNTGVLDKNGVEIYEGDILQCDFSFYAGNGQRERDVSLGKVEFRHGSFMVGFGFNTVYMPDITFGKKVTWLANNARSEWSDFEVIGNIHQNPELLEGR